MAQVGDLADEYAHTHGRKVEDVMSRKLQTVSEQATLEEIVRTMERANVKRVPVLRGSKLVGIITRANLMRALASAARTIPPLAVDDVAIRARVLSELERTLSRGTAGVSVFVRDGSVELFGNILDERLRKSLRVLVENVPGVRASTTTSYFSNPIREGSSRRPRTRWDRNPRQTASRHRKPYPATKRLRVFLFNRNSSAKHSFALMGIRAHSSIPAVDLTMKCATSCWLCSASTTRCRAKRQKSLAQMEDEFAVCGSRRTCGERIS